MPLQYVTKTLGLPSPVNRVSDPHWLFAETVHLAGITGLLVYRSVRIRYTDPIYSSVNDLICRANRVKIIVQEMIKDEGMMGGSAEVMFALLLSSDEDAIPTDPAVIALIDLCETFKGNVAHPLKVTEELVHRLELHRIERAT